MYPGSLADADCIVVQGSNMAENHPVAFRWVMQAKLRGATIIHVDPRYTRTSALADIHVPIRAGTDVAFLGGLIRHVMSNDLDFREYVVNYTNASTLIGEDYRDTEDLDGLFSGFDPETRHYDHASWQYEGMDVPAASGDPKLREQPQDGFSETCGITPGDRKIAPLQDHRGCLYCCAPMHRG